MQRLFFDEHHSYSEVCEGSEPTTDNASTITSFSPRRKIVTISDVDPDVFQKMLDFMEGSFTNVQQQQQQQQHGEGSVGDLNNNNDGGFTLRSNPLAWSLRYAARTYGVQDLVDYCDR